MKPGSSYPPSLRAGPATSLPLLQTVFLISFSSHVRSGPADKLYFQILPARLSSEEMKSLYAGRDGWLCAVRTWDR